MTRRLVGQDVRHGTQSLVGRNSLLTIEYFVEVKKSSIRKAGKGLFAKVM